MAKAPNDKVNARERVRLRRLELDRERIERDQQIDELAEGFYAQLASRDSLLEQAQQIEERMGEHIAQLAALRETPARIQHLLDVDPREYKRLLATAAATTKDRTPAAGTASTAAARSWPAT